MRPKPGAVRRYLAEFLSDPRVIEIPKLLWQPILHGIILRTRPRKSAHAYRQVWTEEGSPLAAITRRQALALQQRLGERVMVEHAMRYGNPGIAAAIERMMARAARASSPRRSIRNIARQRRPAPPTRCSRRIAAMRWQPALRTLPPYHDDPLYIEALRASIEPPARGARFRAAAAAAELPRHAAADARAGRSLSLPLPEDRAPARRSARARCRTSPSSRASAAPNGSSRRPSRCSPLIPAQGVTQIAVAAPGFSADCLETLEELGIRGRETFLARRRNAFRAARLPQ